MLKPSLKICRHSLVSVTIRSEPRLQMGRPQTDDRYQRLQESPRSRRSIDASWINFYWCGAMLGVAQDVQKGPLSSYRELHTLGIEVWLGGRPAAVSLGVSQSNAVITFYAVVKRGR